MSTTVIPAKTYVTIQYRADSSAEGKLGFLSPYTKDAAFNKRKSTQDQWAYGYGITVNINDEDEITVTGQGGGNNRAGTWDSAALFMSNCYPRILDNELLDGFEIAKSVRRYGWSGSGNVLWRIADPRGFELEISSENFSRIIDCATIENGVIKGKCLWGRDGSKNILLPEASDVYQDAVKRTTQVNTKISLNDVQVGDMVELLSKDGKDLGGQYLGKYFFLLLSQGENNNETSRYYRSGNGVYHLNKKQIDRYLFKGEDGYFVLSAPKVTAITEKIETPLNKVEVAQEVTSYLDNTHEISGIDAVIIVSPTKIKFGEVTSKLVPFEYTGELWPVAHRYYTEAIICEMNSKYYISRNVEDSKDTNYPKAKIAKLQECSVSLSENAIQPQFAITQSNNGYWGRNYETRTDVFAESFDLNAVQKYKIEVTANGIVGKLYYLGYY